MAAPVHGVGDVVTASRINIWFINTLFAQKTATESVTSSTTLQDDDHLFVAVEANAVYEIALILSYDAGGAGDLKTSMTVPAGASLVGVASGINSPGTLITDDFVSAWTGVMNPGGLGAGTTAAMSAQGLLTVAGTAGDVRLQWAQLVSSSTATRLFAGSYLLLRRVA